MRHHVEGACDLGEYIEGQDRSRGNGSVFLDGPAQTIRFPDWWRKWFARQTPARLAALDEMVDERLEREALRKFFRRLKHVGIAAVIAGFAGARWFSEQIAWFMAKLPILREFWTLITGSAKP